MRRFASPFRRLFAFDESLSPSPNPLDSSPTAGPVEQPPAEDEYDALFEGMDLTDDALFTPKPSLSKRVAKSEGSPSKRAKTHHVDRSLRYDKDTLIVTIAETEEPCAAGDLEGVPYGVLWEVARLSIDHGWTVPKERLKLLSGSHLVAGPRISQVLSPNYALRLQQQASSPSLPYALPIASYFASERKVRLPWAELDREDQAWTDGHDEGLGLVAPDGWYGGKVHFVGRLSLNPSGRFMIQLEPATIGTSCQLARAFHSRSIITLRVDQSALGPRHLPRLKELLRCRFDIFGQGFRALTARDRKVFLFNEQARRPQAYQYPFGNGEEGFGWVLNYLNPPKLNYKQALSKWTTRFDLYLSNTIPGARLLSHQVGYEDDLPLSDQAETKCPPSDGCGLISPSILQTIQRNVRLPEIPSAVQLRFFGAKGVCLNDLQYAKSSEDDSLITLRPSQVKINCDERYLYDPAKLTVDVVRVAALKIGASLSAEAIIILAESGVPHETLCQIYRHALQEDFSPFLHLPHFSSPLIALIHAVFRLGGVMSERRARAYGGAARARGAISGWRTGENELGSLGPIADEDESEDEGDDGDTLFDEPAGQSLAWYPDDISGLPSSLPETCLLLMLSGFRPDQLEYCGKKLHSFLKTALDGRISKYRLPIPLSVSGIIVPDHTYTLGPGEIFVSLSEPLINPLTGERTLNPTGDCLVYRNPAKLPSDVQKVRAVTCPALRQLQNVIVFNTTDPRRSLASRLAGGDYDGDQCVVIFDPLLVEPFVNSSDNFMVTPPEVINSFDTNPQTLGDFIISMKEWDPVEKDIALLDKRMAHLDVIVGEYSIFRDVAVYQEGIRSREAIRLSHIFNEALDGTKSGKVIKKDVERRDRELYKKYGRPSWSSKSSSVSEPIKRRPELGPFIMDELQDIGNVTKEQIMTTFTKTCESTTKLHIKLPDNFSQDSRAIIGADDLILQLIRDAEATQYHYDSDLVRPWVDAIVNAVSVFRDTQGSRVLLGPLLVIREKVVEAKTLFDQEIVMKYPGSNFTKLPIQTRQDLQRSVSRAYMDSVPLQLLQPTLMDESGLATLKASCAYILSGPSGRFAFTVAFRSLCLIKAQKFAVFHPVATNILEYLNPHQGMVRDVELGNHY